MALTIGDMKGLICTLLLSMILLNISNILHAQDNRLYQFQFKKGRFLTGNESEVYTLMDSLPPGNNYQLFQAEFEGSYSFKLKLSGGSDNYLKRQGDSVKLDALNGSPDFLWSIIYAGHPYGALADPTSSKVLTDVDGKVRMSEVTSPLTSNTDPSGDDFRLTVYTQSISQYRIVQEARANDEMEDHLWQEDGVLHCYPNPITDQAQIVYRLTDSERVYISISDMGGKVVNVLVDDFMIGGEHRAFWDKRNMRGEKVSVGLYVLSAQLGGNKSSQMLIVK